MSGTVCDPVLLDKPVPIRTLKYCGSKVLGQETAWELLVNASTGQRRSTAVGQC